MVLPQRKPLEKVVFFFQVSWRAVPKYRKHDEGVLCLSRLFTYAPWVKAKGLGEAVV